MGRSAPAGRPHSPEADEAILVASTELLAEVGLSVAGLNPRRIGLGALAIRMGARRVVQLVAPSA